MEHLLAAVKSELPAQEKNFLIPCLTEGVVACAELLQCPSQVTCLTWPWDLGIYKDSLNHQDCATVNSAWKTKIWEWFSSTDQVNSV